MKDFDTYTGTLRYNNINFTFVFDKRELKLIPPDDKKKEVESWFWKKMSEGIYTWGNPVYINETLYGISNETFKKIIFIPARREVSRYNSVIIIDVEFYIINKYDRDEIDRISFNGPEITQIFPTNIAIDKIERDDSGKMNIKTKSFLDITTEKEIFKIQNKELKIYFGISKKSSLKTGDAPIILNSAMYIEFEPTNDFEFIRKIISVSKTLIQYLCYRKNISFSNIELSAPAKNGLHEVFANIFETFQNKYIVDEYSSTKKYCIQYEYVKGSIGKILNDIASNKIYIKHIPETYELGRSKNAGDFVMITAGFEWEFKRNYRNGIRKSNTTKEAEEKVNEIIQDAIDKNVGKVKKKLKFIKRFVNFNSLEDKIKEYGNDYNEISDIFGKRLYSINNEILNYNDMGKRLAEQRNHFAHGDIDKEFIGLSLLDLIYLEYIIYIMQLKYYKVDIYNIKRAINDLFGCNIAL